MGGRFHVIMRTPDGEEHDVSGVYREVCPTRIWCYLGVAQHAGTGVSGDGLKGESDGERAVLTLMHEQFFDDAARDAHREGWAGALDKLAASFA